MEIVTQEGCVEELNSVLVKKDIGEETKLQCITDHPGFASICLEKESKNGIFTLQDHNKGKIYSNGIRRKVYYNCCIANRK